jgi:glutamine amidotransferase
MPAAHSPVAALIKEYPCKTLNMLSHLRYATVGSVALENVHPFQREMWGISFIFAHNGDLPKFSLSNRQNPCWLGDVPGPAIYNPIGDTDSEAFFCAILNALRAKFDQLPTLPVLYDELQRLISKAIEGEEENSILNFLLCCGQHVQFAYSWPGSRPNSPVWNGLYYTIREPPFKLARLVDCDMCVDFSEFCHENDRVAIVATFPLTNNEIWIELERGQLILFDEGRPHIAAEECKKCEDRGHGLVSKAFQKLNPPSLGVDTRHTLGLWGGTDI